MGDQLLFWYRYWTDQAESFDTNHPDLSPFTLVFGGGEAWDLRV